MGRNSRRCWNRSSTQNSGYRMLKERRMRCVARTWTAWTQPSKKCEPRRELQSLRPNRAQAEGARAWDIATTGDDETRERWRREFSVAAGDYADTVVKRCVRE